MRGKDHHGFYTLSQHTYSNSQVIHLTNGRRLQLGVLLECFTAKISFQKTKHLAVLRLTVNPTENLTKARRVHHEKRKTSKLYQGFKIAHFLWLTFFYD